MSNPRTSAYSLIMKGEVSAPETYKDTGDRAGLSRIPTPFITSGIPTGGISQDQRGDKGPNNIPAKRYPMIRGCLILKKARVTIAPIIMIKAKSVTNDL